MAAIALLHNNVGRRRRLAITALTVLSTIAALGPMGTDTAGAAVSAPSTSLTPDLPAAMPFSRLADVHLPPPSAPAVPATASASAPVAAPTAQAPEGWTTYSHWKSNGNGTVAQEIYPGPVFRHDAQGWHPVDWSVRPRADRAQPISVENGLVPIRFGTDGSRVVELELNGGPVAISANGLQITTPHLASRDTVQFDNVAASTDLQFRVLQGAIKEQLVLRDPTAPTSFTFFISDPTGQLGTPHAMAPGGPFVFDNAIAPDSYLSIAPAVAYEQSRETHDRASAHLTVDRSGQGFLVTEWVDEAWLAGKSYPIVLDPTVYTSTTIGGSYQSSQMVAYMVRADFTNSGCGTSCFGGPPADLYDQGGVANTWGPTYYHWYDRIMTRYDLTGIPQGSDVRLASSRWFNADCDGAPMGAPCPGAVVEAHRYNGAFPYSGTTMSTIQANTDATVINSQTPCAGGTYSAPCRMDFDIVNQVKAWVAGSDANNGMVFKSQGEGGNIGGPVFYGLNYSPVNASGRYPYLYVEYSPPPSAPGNVAAVMAGPTSATVSWAPASAQNGDPITGYTVTTYTSAGVQVGSPFTCTSCTNTTIGGLSTGGSYYFTVYASNYWTHSSVVQSNTITLTAPPAISKTVDASSLVVGQSTSFHITLSSPSGSAALSTMSDPLPTGLVFANSTIGSVVVQSTGVPGGPTSCTAPACSVSGNTLTLSYSPALTIPQGGTITLQFPVVAVESGRGCAIVTNTATAANAGNSQVASVPVTICEGGLGFENYWQYVTRSLGGGGKAAVNVASGNLVVQQDDSTPVQAHGRLALVLRRTYNSGDTAIATLPGTLGSGWQFNVSETEDVLGDATGAGGLSLSNTAAFVASPFAVVLIDRDGTRHAYQPNALTAAIDIQSLVNSNPVSDLPPTSPLKTLSPLTLALHVPVSEEDFYTPTYSYDHLCVDQTFTPPPGVHMSMWRYIAVQAAAGNVCAPAAGTRAVIAGYGAETTDRVRYEFSVDGRLLAMADAAGNTLQYTYGAIVDTRRIKTRNPFPEVTGYNVPQSITEPSTGRKFTFAPTWNQFDQLIGFQVTDPAQRLTTYKLDGQYPSAHLTEVDNPDGSKLFYAYGSNCASGYGAATGASANQLCSETDLRGNTTYFTYTSTSADGVSYAGLPRATAITDRRESAVTPPGSRQNTTQLAYREPAAPTLPWATADQGGHRQRFQSIDAFGRVGEVDEGTTADNYTHMTLMTWDGNTDFQTNQVTYCRQPDVGRDNNLCHAVRQDTGGAAPDDNVTSTYGDEGQVLATYRCLGTASSNPTSLPPCATTLDTTAGYQEQYFESVGAVVTFSDTATGYNASTGHGGVTSTNRGGSTPNRIDGGTLFAVVDKLQSVPPRGNVSGQPYTTYQTTYTVDANSAVAPSTPLSSGVCPGNVANTGLMCKLDGPAFDGSGAPTETRYTYETHGQRATMATPLAVNQGGGSYSYAYYPDSGGDTTQTRDLSGTTATGGWLKAVTDPTGRFVAYAYDAAGNRVRVWDRNATSSYADATSFPGTASGGGLPCSFTETRWAAGSAYGQCPASVAASAYANPWRYALFQRDQLGNATTSQVDVDGNVTLTRPPRGNPAGSSPVTTYDVTQAFDANDNLACNLKPVEAAGATCANPPAAATTYSYDAFNNRTQTRDPRGHFTVDVYDAVNRVLTHWWSRGPMPAAQFVPAGCHQSGQSGDPSVFGSGGGAPMICASQTAYDRVDNVVSTQDGNAQTTSYTYDSVHRKTTQVTPRDTGITETHGWLYDAEGHVTDDCPPNEFVAPGAGACTTSGTFSTHTQYNASGRADVVTATGGSGTEKTQTIYDADGNAVETCSPRQFSAEGSGTCDAASIFATFTTYNLLDRRTKTKSFHTTGSAPSAVTTAYTYDAAGNVLAVEQPGSQVLAATTTSQDLVIDGTQYPKAAPYVLTSTTNVYPKVILQNGGWLTVAPWSGSSGGVINLTASGDPNPDPRTGRPATGQVVVCSTCGITASGLGSPGGAGGSGGTGAAGTGPGGGGGGRVFIPGAPTSASGGGGGGHATNGSPGTQSTDGQAAGGSGGVTYGQLDLSDSSNAASVMGSGGGGGAAGVLQTGGAGGNGGGFVHISAASISIQGVVTADGAPGGTSAGGAGGGGGSGGSVWLSAPAVSLACCSAISVAAGAAGTGFNNVNGGAGAAGLVRIDAEPPPAAAGSGWGHYDSHLSSVVTAYSYDADNRTVDTVQAADSLSAASAGFADQARNLRTRVMYDADGHVVAQFEPRAFLRPPSGDTRVNPDLLFMMRTDVDADGRPIAQYVPRFDNSADNAAFSDMGLSSSSSTQGAQCPTGASPQSVPPVPTYLSSTAVCVTRVQYDAASNRSQVTTPTVNSDSTSYTQLAYSDDNLVSSITAPDPSHAGSRITAMTYDYDGAARRLRSTDANGIQVVGSYFGDGLLKSTQQATSAHVTTYTYDATGNRKTVTDPVGNATTMSYFSDNRRQEVKDAANDRTTYTYDVAGNTTRVTSPSANAGDANNTATATTLTCYTPDNLVATTLTPVAPAGSQYRQVTYAYDAAGRKLSQQLQLVPSSTCAAQSGTSGGTQGFVYLDDGRIEVQVGRNGETIRQGYDAAGGLASASDSTSGVTLSSSFYLDGSSRAVDDGARTTRFAYDGVGSPTVRVAAVDASSTSYTSTYAYNAAQLLASSSSATVQTAARSLSYDAGGRKTGETYPNAQALSLTYTADNMLSTQTLRKSDSTLQAQWTYTYDNDFRITGQQFSGTGAGSATPNTSTLCYSYDTASRLNGFQVLASGSCGSVPTTIAHDHDGNRTTFTSTTGTQSAYCYNADDSMSSSQPAATPNCPSPPSGSKPLTYAPFGGVADDGCYTYGYDGFDRLTTVTPKPGCTGATAATYTYDALDRQYTHSDGGSTAWLHYDGLTPNVAIETSNAGVDTTYELGPTGQRRGFTVRDGSASQYLTDDGKGNISTVTASSQAVACTVRLDPFGTPIGAAGATNPCNTGTTANDFFYRGGRRDSATGDYQFGARTYDPGKAGFLMPDTYRAETPMTSQAIGTDPITANTYTYVNGDPVNLIDPTGHCSRNPDADSVYTGCMRTSSSDVANPSMGPKPQPSGFNFAGSCGAGCREPQWASARESAASTDDDCGVLWISCVGRTLAGVVVETIATIGKAPTVIGGWAVCLFKGRSTYGCTKQANEQAAKLDQLTNAATGCGDGPSADANRCKAVGAINIALGVLGFLDAFGPEFLDTALVRFLPRVRGDVPVTAPRPPGFNPDTWQSGPASRDISGLHWYDPGGGEWRWHAPDRWHPVGHWDHNPWDQWNSPWQHVYPDSSGNSRAPGGGS
jgi:RHS repeat-associated protein